MLMAANLTNFAIKNQDEKRLFDYKNYKFYSTTAFFFCFLLLRRLFRLARQSQIRIWVKVLHTNSTTRTLFHFGFTASTTLFFLINFYTNQIIQNAIPMGYVPAHTACTRIGLATEKICFVW